MKMELSEKEAMVVLAMRESKMANEAIYEYAKQFSNETEETEKLI